MELPESDHNRGIGNFMVSISLLAVPRSQSQSVNMNNEREVLHFVKKNGKVIYQSSRPAILLQKSSVYRFVQSWLRLLPLLTLGVYQEQQVVSIRLLDWLYDDDVSAVCLNFIFSMPASSCYLSC
jgi:hypothetical protein